MTPDGQIAITLDKAAIREPFVNECNAALCGAVHPKSFGFHTLSATRELSQTIARACYIRGASAP